VSEFRLSAAVGQGSEHVIICGGKLVQCRRSNISGELLKM
jgi:hypothetical protein